MSLFHGTVYSKNLDMRTGLSVFLPREFDPEPPQGIITLLHGLSDRCSNWSENTMLPVFAEEHNVAVLMPEVQRSFYSDMAYGPGYFSYVNEELPQLAKKLFGLEYGREQTAVMGLSMGGYGALKCALTSPQRYGICCAFSSAWDVGQMRKEKVGTHFEKELRAILGDGMALPEGCDIQALLNRCAVGKERPRFYLTCGKQDSLYPMNLRLKGQVEALGYDSAYEEWEGAHDWYFWNESLRRALQRFFPVQG